MNPPERIRPNFIDSNLMSQVRPYYVAPLPYSGKIDTSVKLEKRTSQLRTTFPEGKNQGLFTLEPLTRGTLILSQNGESEAPFNDPQVDLTSVLKAKSSYELYQAFCELRENYYNLEQIRERVNVRLVIDPEGKMFWQTLKDVPMGTELTRLYGLSTWIIETTHLLTRRNLAGYAQFVLDLIQTPDPLRERMIILAETLERHYLSEYFILPWRIDLQKYDCDFINFESEKMEDYLLFNFRLNKLLLD